MTAAAVLLLLLVAVACLSAAGAQSFRNCFIADLSVNCTSVTLSSVPIIFNPRLTQLTLRNTSISQLGQSRPLDVYTRVQFLDLSQNNLTLIPDEAFRNLKLLRVSVARTPFPPVSCVATTCF